MSDSAKKITWFSIVVLVVAMLDQLSKYLIRTSPDLHQLTLIEDWLMFNLTTNPGMAMGIQWAPTWVISVVAILATIGITWYAMNIRMHANMGFIVCMGLIIGGAVGNIMDRLYMGFVGGYGGLLEGHVVDFIHFTWVWPEWMPFVGGNPSFPYIFNVADIAISVAIITLIVFAKWLLPDDPPKKAEVKSGDQVTPVNTVAEIPVTSEKEQSASKPFTADEGTDTHPEKPADTNSAK